MTSRGPIDNLGIPPLAGLCTYEEACRVGFDVDANVNLLKRYNYASRRLHESLVAHVPRTPEWEVKCAMGLHQWILAEHCAWIRRRVSEMREPPLHLDQCPDPKLELWMEETIRAESTVELLTGIYSVGIPELIETYQWHLERTNPMIDHPTCRILRLMLSELESMATWGKQALSAIIRTESDATSAKDWEDHVRAYLAEAGGIAGEPARFAAAPLPTPRSNGEPYEMDVVPKRDARFTDPYNQSALIDEYYKDESRAPDERTYALLYKRLREMDVPEYMAPIIFKTKGKPWEYYADLGRQLWDETRHAMMGEVGLYQDGVPFYRYPIDLKTSLTANTQLEPLQAHLILTGIELSLMPKKTGKRFEWVIAKSSGNDLAATIQDYDWADEVLHAQIGRRWLVPEFGSLEKLQSAYDELWPRWWALSLEKRALSEQKEWWSEFLREIRASKLAK
ncbi:hypothetical protein [Paenibacillus sp.]|uniref:hypothetical protein n=1 Tax=Paenibacillus sp. TaxID=58172 RepID=UPI002D230169|nr:hypothetical protein [Paenibacillus sp.]HZG58094.1 hypothetical protein [Paenibacillus sp.]